MFTTHQTMDDRSLELRRDGAFIGHILWHPGRPVRIQFMNGNDYIRLDEIEIVTRDYKEAEARRRSWQEGTVYDRGPAG